MVQGFYNAFKLRKDPTIINSGGFDGINLALLKRLKTKAELLEKQMIELNELKGELKK